MIFLLTLTQAALFGYMVVGDNSTLGLPVQLFLIILNGVLLNAIFNLGKHNGRT
jgi:hypothetical protein